MPWLYFSKAEVSWSLWKAWLKAYVKCSCWSFLCATGIFQEVVSAPRFLILHRDVTDWLLPNSLMSYKERSFLLDEKESMMHCGIQNITGVILTMHGIVKWAGVASLWFHKNPFATWGPISDWHCCMQKPAPSCFLVHQRPRDGKVLWRLSSDCRILLAPKSEISSELPVLPMVFIPLDFESLCITQSLLGNMMHKREHKQFKLFHIFVSFPFILWYKTYNMFYIVFISDIELLFSLLSFDHHSVIVIIRFLQGRFN